MTGAQANLLRFHNFGKNVCQSVTNDYGIKSVSSEKTNGGHLAAILF
jgi:hypothetical protein